MEMQRSTDFIHKLKLKFYRQALFLALAVVLFLWWQIVASGATETSDFYVYPIYLVFCGLSLWLLAKYKTAYLPILETTGFILTFLYFSLSFSIRVYAALSQPELSFRKFLIWIPILYGIAFLIYSPKTALRLSGLFLTSILLPGIGYGLLKRSAPGFKNDFTLLLQIYASGLIYSSLFYIIAALKEQIVESDKQVKAATSRADTDALTKIYSRSKILEILDGCVSSSRTPLALAFIDVDRLKQINDSYGHAIGDLVLRRMAEVLERNLRGNDSLGRLGGDEFLLVLPNTDIYQAQIIARRLEIATTQAEFGNRERVTISIGVVEKQAGDSRDTLLARADKKMYEQKSQRRKERA